MKKFVYEIKVNGNKLFKGIYKQEFIIEKDSINNIYAEDFYKYIETTEIEDEYGEVIGELNDGCNNSRTYLKFIVDFRIPFEKYNRYETFKKIKVIEFQLTDVIDEHY